MNEKPGIQEIRLYVDGEMTPEQVTRFEQILEHDADLQHHVEFEQRLRDHVASVLRRQNQTAPVELPGRIRTVFLDTERESSDSSDRDFVIGRVTPETSKTILAKPVRANVFAVAASLMLVAGAILFGIFGPSIDDSWVDTTFDDIIHDAAAFVSSEHTRCAMSERDLQDKLIYDEKAIARSTLARHLGVDQLPDFDLSSLGYSFVGGGPCMVPTFEVSGHFMFRSDTPVGDLYPMVSIFMVPSDGSLRFDATSPETDSRLPGADGTNWSECDGGPACIRRVLRSTNKQVNFFICCCMDDDLDKIARLLGEQLAGP